MYSTMKLKPQKRSITPHPNPPPQGGRGKAKYIPLMLLLLTTACAIGPDYERPEIATPLAFKEAQAPEAVNQLEKANPSDDAPRGKWWEVFGDKNLNELEEQVAISNQTVKAASASLLQAQALVSETTAGFFPTIAADASKNRANSANTTKTSYSASLQVSWTPDFWGKVRRQLEASEASAEASKANLALAILTAQSTLAVDYLDLRIADEQKRLLTSTVAGYTKSLEITQNQYKAGIAANSDVLQAKVQLENAQVQLTDIGVARSQFEHAIAVLTGKAPADFSIAELDSVPSLPEIPVAVPADLLERRPDIAASERNVAAANADIGVAEAAYFPDITLSAAGGYNSSNLSKLLTLPNRFWSIGPTLAETIFDAGLRGAQTDAAIAAYDQTVANYRQTVLTAFQEVEDNLSALRIYGKEAETLDLEVNDASKSADVAMNQYKAGIVSYLNVVTAQTASLNAKLTALNLRKSRLTAMVSLIENLGGGWNAGQGSLMN